MTFLAIDGLITVAFFVFRWLRSPKPGTRRLAITVWAAFGPHQSAEKAGDILWRASKVVFGDEGLAEHQEWIDGHIKSFHEWRAEDRFVAAEKAMRRGLSRAAYGRPFCDACENLVDEAVTEVAEALHEAQDAHDSHGEQSPQIRELLQSSTITWLTELAEKEIRAIVGEEWVLRFPKTAATLLAVLGFGFTVIILFLWRSDSVPGKNDLIATSGQIAKVRTVTRPSGEMAEFLFEESPTKYMYEDWYPHFHRLRDHLVVGESLTVFTLPDDNQVWRVQSGNRDIVPYHDLASAHSGNRRMALILAIVMAIGTVIGLLDLYRSARQRSPSAVSS